MRIPYVNDTRKSVRFTQNFRGYYHALRTRPGDDGQDDETTFYDMQNMSLDRYPVITTRAGRKRVELPSWNGGESGTVSIFPVADKLLIAQGTLLMFGSFDDSFDYVCEVSDSRKQFAVIGAKVLIIPDNIVFNCHTREVEEVRITCQSHSYGGLTITPCIMGDDGTYSSVTYYSSDTEPEDRTVYWYDTVNKTLKKYSGVSYSWVGVATAFLKLQASYQDLWNLFTDHVNNWDTLSFTELRCSDYDLQMQLDQIAKNDGEEGKGDNIIYEHGNGYVVIAGLLTEAITVSSYVIERRMPDLDYIAALNNRIWGCNSEKHEVYSCKLGDPLQWYNYPGLASDSYAATIGSLGDFTGATSLNSYALFFKEHSMFKVYGDYPANFQIVEIVCDGVQKGSEASIRETSGQLFYKGANGLMVYDGSIPTPFTDALGDIDYHNATAGTIQNKYYISMANSAGEYSLFAYDAIHGHLTKEDDFHAVQFARYKNKLLVVDENEHVWEFPEDCDEDIDEYGNAHIIEWMVETCNLGLGTPLQKYISRIQLRFELDGYARIFISYDDGDYRPVFSKYTKELRSFTVPIRVKRCDHFRIKITGEGPMRLYSYGYNVEQGSEKQC